MNEEVLWYGKCKKVDLETTLEEWCEKYCKENGENEIPNYYDNWIETFRDTLEYDSCYKIINNDLYEIINLNDDYDTDIFKASKNPDGTINFVLKYYDGSHNFTEALGKAIDRMGKEE